MAIGLLISAWLVASVGGVHCLAMCGGFMTAVSARDRAGSPAAIRLQPRREILRSQLAYHGGRIATYMTLGALFGGLGATLLSTASLLPLQRALYVGANLFLLLLGIFVAVKATGVPWLQRAGGRLFAQVLPRLTPLLRRPGMAGRLLLGVAWGFMPCGLVYSVLPLALFAGGGLEGAAVMLAFGVGTLPSLVFTSWLLRRSGSWLERPALRLAIGAVLVNFALFGIYRALLVPGALAQGPFCLVS